MTIPFEVPAELTARFLAGGLVRNGALLREPGTGRIVAHLQEASGLAQMARGVSIRLVSLPEMPRSTRTSR
jgi:hypothetical protein